MGRAHGPRGAAVGGSCEDRGVATRSGIRGHTAKAAGPDRAPRGRIAGTALWRAARRRRSEDMNLIQTLEREAIDALTEIRAIPEFRPGDTLRVGVKVVRRGAVRRAKLYYLRGRTGKSALIAERRDPRREAAKADKGREAAKAD